VAAVGRPSERCTVWAKEIDVIGIDKRQLGHKRVKFGDKAASAMVEVERFIARPESIATRETQPVAANIA
jgi:hypothetical protein